MRGKICIVTGAGQGLGRAIALEFAVHGAGAVVVADINAESGEETAELVRAAGAAASFARTDLMSSQSIGQMVDAVASEYGGVDVLVNNAGVLDSALTDRVGVEHLDEEIWDRVFGVNLKGMWLATKFAAPHLRRSQRGPAIVNAASVSGVTGYPGAPAYCASKGGVIQLTRVTAAELAPYVRCNCFSPGSFDTPMARAFAESSPDPDTVRKFMTGPHLLPRYGQPAELGKLVAFLASDDSSFITGENIMIDGGTMAWRGLR
jgi:NAD(P)-dependent dehydrogenase (short-subunit alcohol dehydrogenase family)